MTTNTKTSQRPLGADITPAGLAKVAGHRECNTPENLGIKSRARRVDPSDIIAMNNDQLDAHCDRYAALVAALELTTQHAAELEESGYACPDLLAIARAALAAAQDSQP
jgi:hypothetical protein